MRLAYQNITPTQDHIIENWVIPVFFNTRKEGVMAND